MRLCTPGECEWVKASAHGEMGALARIWVADNAWAYGQRREPHLLVNTGLYALLVAWELSHVQHHLKER